MKQIKLTDEKTSEETIVHIYEDCSELPAHRYNEFQFYVSLAMNIDFQNLGNYFHSLGTHIQKENKQEALAGLFNIKLAFNNALNKISPLDLAFGHMVKAINEDPIEDYTEGALKPILQDLSQKGLTRGHIEETVHTVKKKFIPNLLTEV
jgi:hypothetical protein